MSNNAQKTPLARSLNAFAEKKINDAFQRSGQALPCSVVSVEGAIITVKFEVNSVYTLPNVTVPMFGAEYIRYPIRAGDKGCVFPAAARLGGMSGIGGGIADLSQPANLTALVFAPISNSGWVTVDPDAVVLYGPNGVVLRDTDSGSTVTLTPSGIAIETPELEITTSGNVTINCGGDTTVSCVNLSATASDSATVTAPDISMVGDVSVTGGLSVTGNITTPSDVVAGVISLKLHKTSLVTVGTGIGGPPVP